MTNPRCNWVRDRLPLLAGVELLGAERRRVERHLIGCAQCREHRHALGRALDVLHAAAAEPPTAAEAGSLWPALARQIRESRRPSPAPGFAWASLFGLRPRFWPTFSQTMSLLAALGATVALRQQTATARSRIRWAARPLPPLDIRPVAPAPLPSRVVQTDPAPEAAPPARYDYDLEHGTPKNPDPVDGMISTKSATY